MPGVVCMHRHTIPGPSGGDFLRGTRDAGGCLYEQTFAGLVSIPLAVGPDVSAADRYVERDEIAFLMDVTPRTVTNYRKHHSDFPCRVSGRAVTFPVKRCLQWQRDRIVADAIADVAPPVPSNIVQAELRKTIADAELAELKVGRMRGDLLAVQVAAKEIRNAFGRVRARLLSTPGEYAPQMLHLEEMPQAVSKLRQLVDTVLAELQATAGGDAIDDDGGGPDTPDSGDDSGDSGDSEPSDEREVA
jgi:phage terminase Nu1 subunit (DNA packaging protein)